MISIEEIEKRLEKLRVEYKTSLMREIVVRQARALQIAKEKLIKKGVNRL